MQIELHGYETYNALLVAYIPTGTDRPLSSGNHDAGSPSSGSLGLGVSQGSHIAQAATSDFSVGFLEWPGASPSLAMLSH
jgi:hypothetical protein